MKSMMLAAAAIARRKGNSAPALGTYDEEVMADSPVAYWRLNEASGTTAADETTSYPGSHVSGDAGDTGVTGRVDLAVLYGSGNRLTTCGTTVGNYTTGDFTIEFLCNYSSFPSSSSADGNIPISKSGDFNTGWFVFVTTTGRVQLAVYTPSQVDSASDAGVITTGNWHHVAIVKSGTTATFYVDGVDVTDTGTTAGTLVSASAFNFIIGGYSSLNFESEAVIDEVAVYSSALSGARIAAHFAALP